MDFERKQSYLEIPIQVGVRLRPVLDTDDPPSDERVELLATGQVTVEGHLFEPTFCLPASVGQQELYAAAVEPQVEMLLQGYNVAVVTFGQTGSGKTFTLVGPDATFAMSEAEFGVLPRAVRHVFAALKQSSHEVAEHAFTVRASYLEVGEEEIRDLLNYEPVSYHLDVQYDEEGSPVVPGLTRLECSSVSEVLHCLEAGSSMRQAGSTAASDQQAHTVFTVQVQQEWADGVLLHETSSSMYFVELSGSELQPAPDDPDDFTINAGLLALRHVVEALARRRPSVPYHLAPLPALLKDVIGGNCRTLVLCCLSPADTDESLNSLQYVRLLPAVINLVTCGAVQRPLPPSSDPPPAEQAGPARQVHPVHPLRHPLQAASPRPDGKPPPAGWAQGGYGAAPGYGPELDAPPAVGWGPTAAPPAGYGAGYGPGFGGQRRLSSAQQRLSGHGAVMSPAQQMVGGQTQQLMSPTQPAMNQSQHMMAVNQPVVNHSPALINANQQIMNQNQALMTHSQQEQMMLNQNQQLLSPNQMGLNQTMNQNHQMNLNQMNQPLSPLNQPLMNQSHAHSQSLAVQQSLNPSLSQSFPALAHPLSAATPGHLLSQTVPSFGSHQNLSVSQPPRPAGGGHHSHQSALVHPYHHQASPAGRLAGLGYTASPPLTSLTELSCQRAALLHENALVDLYQRLHVLEMHQLAAAQLEFAADQYRRLVAGAERLLRQLAGRGAVDGEHNGLIQQWMCRKQETEECLRQEQEAGSELRPPDSTESDTDTDAPAAQRAPAHGAGTNNVSGGAVSRLPASELDGLSESLSTGLRLGDRPGALDTTPAGEYSGECAGEESTQDNYLHH
ncbi:kinesin-like protein KIF18B [Amphibalanus amphitrite]|uniref:kinesin-like protein KIF18B n=1 Tax=Amphibalanus amphitrite TaxID=1232801 RepID=UPI001C908D41|nr:kinesin-like protein KIF18B [Amphibalanus amphitrite]